MRFGFCSFGLMALIPAGAFDGAFWSDIVGVAGGGALMIVDVIHRRSNPHPEGAS